MKYTIYGISLSAIAVLAVVAVLVFSGRNVRKNEVETALNTAVEQSLEQLKSKKGYEIKSQQELVAEFNRMLLLQVESDAGLQVDILTADAQKGALDVKVTETYQNILGNPEMVTCRKSVIIEEYVEKKAYFTVTFLVEGEVYHQYTVCQGGTVVLPAVPKADGKAFSYWVCQGEGGAAKPEELSIEGDLVLEGVFAG